jgi:hypothetical protein
LPHLSREDKDEAAKKFLNFVGHLERRFDCRIQELRTDGGGKYTDIARQRTEAENSVVNG